MALSLTITLGSCELISSYARMVLRMRWNKSWPTHILMRCKSFVVTAAASSRIVSLRCAIDTESGVPLLIPGVWPGYSLSCPTCCSYAC